MTINDCETHLDIVQLLNKYYTTEGNNWHVTLFSDGSGDLYLPGDLKTGLTTFTDLKQLKEIAAVIIGKINLNGLSTDKDVLDWVIEWERT